jgi:hypothetical protein
MDRWLATKPSLASKLLQVEPDLEYRLVSVARPEPAETTGESKPMKRGNLPGTETNPHPRRGGIAGYQLKSGGEGNADKR